MDEVRIVRASYPEPASPTAREIAQAKALLNDPPRRSRPKLRWGLTGLVAAGAATAVAVALMGRNTPTPPRPGPVRLDDRTAFLAAAEKAGRQPIGKYWNVDKIEGQSYLVRARTGTYAITGANTESFSRWGAEPGTGEAFYGRDLPAWPLTARDASLWRGAGSPSSLRVWSGDHYATYTTKVTKWKSDGPERGTNPHGGGDFPGGVSSRDLPGLPADQASLAARFLSEAEMRKAGGRPPGGPRTEAPAKISRVASLLAAPIRPKVRAGLMRALADQPGIHSIGHDTDVLGRRGVALASDDRAVTVTGASGTPKAERGTYRSRTVIIFDEHTGAVLSEQEELTEPGGPYAGMKPGFVIDHWTVRSANWTATEQNPPAGLPFG